MLNQGQETNTTNRLHTNKRGWTVSSDTKTVQRFGAVDKKVIHHDNGGKFTAFYYHLHYAPIEMKFDDLQSALAWKPINTDSP